jgi:hypothetical protein
VPPRGTVSNALELNPSYRSNMAWVDSFVNLSFPKPTRIALPASSKPFNLSSASRAAGGSRNLG